MKDWLDLEKNYLPESPETLPKEIYNEVKREIAKRILSEKKENGGHVKNFILNVTI